MRTSATVIGVLLAVLVFCTQSIAAVGINYKGSSMCGPFRGGKLTDLIEKAQAVPTMKMHHNGEGVACVGSKIDPLICAFPQRLQNTVIGVGISGLRAKQLLQYLKENNCQKCGSVPVKYPETNNVLDGMLTVNYVTKDPFGDFVADTGEEVYIEHILNAASVDTQD